MKYHRNYYNRQSIPPQSPTQARTEVKAKYVPLLDKSFDTLSARDFELYRRIFSQGIETRTRFL